VRVDGNDVLAVYAVTRDAVDRARHGEGPTLIEALTYRIGAHSTADDARRYRADPDVEAARAFDPIPRFRTWLVGAGHADDAFIASCDEEAEAFALTVREGVVATPTPPAEWAFDWVYAAPPVTFERMRAEALAMETG
jgi:pyruvate dehydrogenase E1 component alpha subunit